MAGILIVLEVVWLIAIYCSRWGSMMSMLLGWDFTRNQLSTIVLSLSWILISTSNMDSKKKTRLIDQARKRRIRKAISLRDS